MYLNDFELESLSCKVILQSEIQLATFFTGFTLLQVHVHQGQASALPESKLWKITSTSFIEKSCCYQES